MRHTRRKYATRGVTWCVSTTGAAVDHHNTSIQDSIRHSSLVKNKPHQRHATQLRFEPDSVTTSSSDSDKLIQRAGGLEESDSVSERGRYSKEHDGIDCDAALDSNTDNELLHGGEEMEQYQGEHAASRAYDDNDSDESGEDDYGDGGLLLASEEEDNLRGGVLWADDYDSEGADVVDLDSGVRMLHGCNDDYVVNSDSDIMAEYTRL
ncbi:hypothetical protein BD413DRAFT_655392 [Trametes elegans]|nr:hypothetical protein BD413DRAFT_655392 [Trametes elegans]